MPNNKPVVSELPKDSETNVDINKLLDNEEDDVVIDEIVADQQNNP